ncbi:HAD-IIIC family phosphatase [Gluconobacter sp. P1C6_b]|uniref:HAD-IIIC family phosphatase n=1 Tax=Gluconobacter sp. P1C6_b TaxID=2762619 RepID=UPI001C0545F7|nr:HAD-IIIC family phosphatase [Gluconobacter sp. P1C6_b]
MEYKFKEAIRLIIWDLDETFWQGTLTEGGIRYSEHNHDLIIALSKRGIINSICSKNDHEEIENILREKKLWDYFVFPSINWQAKGPRIKALIDDIQLRPQTVLFIDDNPSNIAEVYDACPGINVATPEIINQILSMPDFKGKTDPDMTRLKNYKVLEDKAIIKKSFESNPNEFLRESEITVTFDYDINANIDRAIEIINRTNQLNFTKQRLPEDLSQAKEILHNQLRHHSSHAALIKVKDKFGDYGFVGFYLLSKSISEGSRLIHYCFSCRTLGMYVEKWVYDQLERPKIDVAPPVITDLFVELDIDWINTHKTSNDDPLQLQNDLMIVARGGCEMMSLSHYLYSITDNIKGEFSQVRDKIEKRLEHSTFYPHLLKFQNDRENFAALQKLGYSENELTTEVFSKFSGKKVVILSLWSDVYYPAYKHRISGEKIHFSVYPAFRQSSIDITSCNLDNMDPSYKGTWFEDAVKEVNENYEFIGQVGNEETYKNLNCIIDSFNNDELLILLGANEKRTNPEDKYSGDENIINLNNLCRSVEFENEKVKFIDINPLVQKFGITDDPNHFPRELYYDLFKIVQLTIEDYYNSSKDISAFDILV